MASLDSNEDGSEFPRRGSSLEEKIGRDGYEEVREVGEGEKPGIVASAAKNRRVTKPAVAIEAEKARTIQHYEELKKLRQQADDIWKKKESLIQVNIIFI